MKSHTKIFRDIYDNNKWGDPEFKKGGGSGAGSHPKYCKKFIDWLLAYIEENKIESILDLGCGDFRIPSYYYKVVDHYYTVDVVKKFPTNLSFNFMETDFSIPKNLRRIFEWSGPVDLVIIKDVLMHWTDEEIERFLTVFSVRPWKRCIITGRHKYVRSPHLNGSPRNPRGNKYSSSPLPHDHKSLSRLPFEPVLYYPTRSGMQVCECINSKIIR